MKSALISPLLAGLLLLTGCAQPAAQAGGGGGGTIKAINHTKWAINHFSMPDYNGQDVCGITVHFLPCDDVKVTTSCWSPRNVNYPIKEPVRMTEPAVCPK
ncbi:DUF3304 domain-containing protein [Klebsiella pneumoniae]|nr:DUF3304 domain-containing protein [Klebsiella pneumoniae]RCK86017.1 DUF3304 domain-containing protein [Klebsiella pneumoniae]